MTTPQIIKHGGQLNLEFLQVHLSSEHEWDVGSVVIGAISVIGNTVNANAGLSIRQPPRVRKTSSSYTVAEGIGVAVGVFPTPMPFGVGVLVGV